MKATRSDSSFLPSLSCFFPRWQSSGSWWNWRKSGLTWTTKPLYLASSEPKLQKSDSSREPQNKRLAVQVHPKFCLNSDLNSRGSFFTTDLIFSIDQFRTCGLAILPTGAIGIVNFFIKHIDWFEIILKANDACVFVSEPCRSFPTISAQSAVSRCPIQPLCTWHLAHLVWFHLRPWK